MKSKHKDIKFLYQNTTDLSVTEIGSWASALGKGQLEQRISLERRMLTHSDF